MLTFRQRLFPRAETLEFYPATAVLPRKAVPFVWHFVRLLGVPVSIVTLCYTVATIALVLEPYFLGRFVEALKDGAGLRQIWKIIFLYVAICQIFSRFLFHAGHVFEALTMPALTMLVRRELGIYVYKHSYRYFQEDFSGRLAGKVVEMPQAVHDILRDLLGSILYIAVNGVSSVVLFTYLDWRFGILSALYLGLTVALCRWRVPILSRKADIAAGLRQIMRGRYIDGISNILTVKLFAREAHEVRLFSSAMAETVKAEQKQGWEMVLLFRGEHVLNGLLMILIVTMGFYLYRSGILSLGNLTAGLTLSVSMVMNCWWLLQLSTEFFGRFATIDEALGTIIQEHEIRDAAMPAQLSGQRSDINFDSVTFAYPGRSVFDGFSLNLVQGQRVGLVGPSGAGKSTLVQLLLRLFDIQGGAIRIGGQDIREISQHDLRNAIAVIPQSNELMHRSVRDNIRYGRLDATDENVIAAAKQAFIHETIESLRDAGGNTGYDAVVGERGVKLSGGQRQRIVIARAFLKNAPILILDEATSALDSESERLIQASLGELFRGKTVIVIAHRLSTIAHLDRIVVMNNGAIVEEGAHAELLAAGGLYARLWTLQTEGFLAAG